MRRLRNVAAAQPDNINAVSHPLTYTRMCAHTQSARAVVLLACPLPFRRHPVLKKPTMIYIAPFGMTGLRPSIPLSFSKQSFELASRCDRTCWKKALGVPSSTTGRADWIKEQDPKMSCERALSPGRTCSVNTPMGSWIRTYFVGEARLCEPRAL